MDWRDYISCNPNILAGKPAVMGTRLGVEFLLGFFTGPFSEEDAYRGFRLAPEALRAVFAYGAECVAEYAAPLVEAEAA